MSESNTVWAPCSANEPGMPKDTVLKVHPSWGSDGMIPQKILKSIMAKSCRPGSLGTVTESAEL